MADEAATVSAEGHRTAELVSFCRREHPRLVGTLGLLVGDVALAEDLAQEALLRACRNWDRVGGLESPGGWTHRVAVNLARSALRSRTTRRRVDARLAAASGERTIAHDPDRADVFAVRRAVRSLPERQRIALVLRYYADLSVSEVADVMGCPEGTVKTLTSRAISGLRDMGLEAEA
jgi:RNA polymerase sigma-70 factor (sigma-E family)